VSKNRLVDNIEHHSWFTDQHREVPWRSMRGMRNRIAHGYFDINLEVVWETVRTALPELLAKLPGILLDANGAERGDTTT
jgi:uncharacterized protein with HEPN domain